MNAESQMINLGGSKTWCLIFLLLYILLSRTFAYKFNQKSALVRNANAKYVKDVRMLTVRSKRGDAYKTNVTTTLLWESNDNVTISLVYGVKGGQQISLEEKLCKILKMPWAKPFINKYLNQPISSCPLEAGVYKIHGLDLPPKNFPFPIFRGTLHVDVSFRQTETREIMVSYIIVVQVT